MICEGVERYERGKVTFLIGKMPDYLRLRRREQVLEAYGSLWNIMMSHLRPS
jgi:hypothetical protein